MLDDRQKSMGVERTFEFGICLGMLVSVDLGVLFCGIPVFCVSVVQPFRHFQ